jgi:ABC-type branched-subunit amino acid transport system substrate-binding protein
VFIGAAYDQARMIKALSRTLGPRVQLLTPDAFYAFPELAQKAGASTEGMTITVAGRPLSALPPAGRTFAAALARALGHEPHPYAIYAAEATHVLLNAIARSDGARGSVTRALLRTRRRGGLLGDFAIDADGDTTQGAVTVYRVHDGKPRLAGVVTPPARLVGTGG